MNGLGENVDQATGNRLSPAGLIIGFIAGLPGLIFPILAVLYGAGRSDRSPLFAPFMIAAILVASLIFRWIAWMRFRYYTGDEDIRIESGLFSRSARSIPYDRIQDVGIEQKPLARIFGLGEVKFETGSGTGEDGKLSYVAIKEAERLRELVRVYKTDTVRGKGLDTALDAEASTANNADHDGASPLFAMDMGRVLALGFYSFSLIILAILGGIAQQFDFLLPFDLYDISAWLGLAKENGNALDNIGWRARFFVGSGALLILMLVGIATGIMITILRENGFRLDQTLRGFRRRRGLLTLTDVVMPIQRVQAATVYTGPIRKLRGWHGLKFISLASDSSGNKKGDSDHVVAPLAYMDEIARIAVVAEISLPNPDMRLLRGELRYWLNRLIIVMPMIMAGILALLIFTDTAAHSLWLLLVLPIFGLSAILQWRLNLHRMDGDFLFVGRGWWRQQMTIAPQIKVQTVEISQGPLARWNGLCSIHFGIAGGSLEIPGLTLADARTIVAQVMSRVAAVDYSQISAVPDARCHRAVLSELQSH